MNRRLLEGWVVAFDLDGTLVDTAPDLIGALNVVLAECGLAPQPVAAARSLVGRGARYMIAHGFEQQGAAAPAAELPALEARLVDVYRDRIANLSRPFPGCEAALDALAQDGALLAVCTNKRTTLARPLLDAVGLTDRFAFIAGGDLVAVGKPDPGLLLLAVERAGGAPSRAVMVGDASTDTGAARGAGVPCVVVDWGYTEIPPAELGGDALISQFHELPDAVRRLAAVAA